MNELPLRLPGCSVLPPRDDIEPTHNADRRNGHASPQQRSKAKGPSENRKAAADRFAVLNSFVDFTMAGLTRSELATWLTLYRDTKDGTARTAVSDLARRTGMDRRNVLRAIRTLEQRGLLQVVMRGSLRKGASIYRVRSLDETT